MITTPKTPENDPDQFDAFTVDWMTSLGSKFVEVWLYLPESRTLTVDWLDERHIDDPDTLETTVSMSLERLGGNYAVWACDAGWVLYRRRPGYLRVLPSREAAEMLAIHGG